MLKSQKNEGGRRRILIYGIQEVCGSLVHVFLFLILILALPD